jgi:hypothetical protein
LMEHLVGKPVQYYPQAYVPDSDHYPFAAIICHVQNVDFVNIVWFSEAGQPQSASNVRIVREDETYMGPACLISRGRTS